jgi:hypothetical protein
VAAEHTKHTHLVVFWRRRRKHSILECVIWLFEGRGMAKTYEHTAAVFMLFDMNQYQDTSARVCFFIRRAACCNTPGDLERKIS